MATWGPKKISRFTATLIPLEEVSDVQLSRFQRHKKNGTSPGNPKWYRAQVIKPFVPQLSQKIYRVESGAEFHTAHSTSMEDPFHKARGFDGLDYVRAYEIAAGLRVTVAEPQRKAA